jgi:uncharacterized protein
MKKRSVVLGGNKLTLPFAIEEDEQEKGLSGRESLGPNEGMVFEYHFQSMTGYWMKDVPFDLDIAFVNSEGDIFQISHLKANDDTVIFPKSPYKWAIEMPSGWFDKNLKGYKFKVDIQNGIH